MPLSGLERAWRWSLNPVLYFAGALTGDGKRLLQTNQRGAHDEELARAVIAFARAHEEELLANNRSLRFVEGLGAEGAEGTEGYGFDAVAAVAPEVHGHYGARNPELMAATYIVFPGWASEFSGRETSAEAGARYLRMLRPAEIRRDPVPFLKMRFDNPSTGGGSNPSTGAGSTGSGRALTYPRILRQEIAQLEGAPGGFVEFENRHGAAWRVEWDGGWVVEEEGSGVRREIGLEPLLAFADGRLRD
ncbi:hypothetical protein [Streptomyces sp. MMBL 11-3]|uniref:hypothetical protein n=1 Tax=Streptomyces sp. MMBL 11-3 TaxID=3382639 RepID=UPI0039B61961